MKFIMSLNLEATNVLLKFTLLKHDLQIYALQKPCMNLIKLSFQAWNLFHIID